MEILVADQEIPLDRHGTEHKCSAQEQSSTAMAAMRSPNIGLSTEGPLVVLYAWAGELCGLGRWPGGKTDLTVSERPNVTVSLSERTVTVWSFGHRR